jgi:hypothetical protein
MFQNKGTGTDCFALLVFCPQGFQLRSFYKTQTQTLHNDVRYRVLKFKKVYLFILYLFNKRSYISTSTLF